MARAVLLILILYTGPVAELPEAQARKVIPIVVPSALAANTPVCAIG